MTTLFKTLVDVTDGLIVRSCSIDTISWREHLWLVPKWRRAKTDGNRQPVRLARPQLFSFERPAANMVGVDYCLSCAIPRTILGGQISSEGPIVFDIVEDPEIEFPIPNVQ